MKKKLLFSSTLLAITATIDGKNKFRPNRLRWLLASGCMAFLLYGCSRQQPAEDVVFLPKSQIPAVRVAADSLSVPFLFYPERWFLNGHQLYVLNSRESPFLSILNLSDRSWRQWGEKGNGPHEYVIPSLCEMRRPHEVGIYSNGQNRLDIYHTASDSLRLQQTYSFPLWNEEKGIPKAYTRMLQFNDSLFVGTSFMPRQIVVELLDLKKNLIVDEAHLSLQPKEKEYTGPYECQVAIGSDYMVAAYRYANRLDFFRLSPNGFHRAFCIGDKNEETQYDLFQQDRDDEMVFHYADIACGKEKIYALYQGVAVKDLASVHSRIEIYSPSGQPLKTVDLGRSVECILVDDAHQTAYAYDRNEEGDYVYRYVLE